MNKKVHCSLRHWPFIQRNTMLCIHLKQQCRIYWCGKMSTTHCWVGNELRIIWDNACKEFATVLAYSKLSINVTNKFSCLSLIINSFWNTACLLQCYSLFETCICSLSSMLSIQEQFPPLPSKRNERREEGREGGRERRDLLIFFVLMTYTLFLAQNSLVPGY